MEYLKERFSALSDAVVAIVMTILVLEIAVPADLSEFPKLFESIGIFLVSFVLVVNFWYQRLWAMRGAKETSGQVFLLDVVAHAFLSLYPLATKILIDFQDRRVSILFFGLVTLVTQICLNTMIILLAKMGAKDEREADNTFFFEWLKKRFIASFIMDIVILLLALCFNQFGIFIYLLSPFVEFISNYKRIDFIDSSLKHDITFKEFLSRIEETRKR